MKGSRIRSILRATAITIFAASMTACAVDASRPDYRYKPGSDAHAVVTTIAPRPNYHGGPSLIRIEEVNGRLINKASRGAVSLPPGQHSIRIAGANHGSMNITVEAGKTYYIAVDRGLIVHRIDNSATGEILWLREELDLTGNDRE